MNILLRGTVGSTAYGLANEDSDVDRLGIFVTFTNDLLRLNPPRETLTTIKPDITFHEVGKFVKLALNVNPTVTELMWLDSYDCTTEFGEQLIKLRKSFLSKNRVRNAYLGYATQQFSRLKNREDGSFSSDTRKRTAKHARHLGRLLHQGLGLYSTGNLKVKLENPEWYFEFGDSVAQGNTDIARKLLTATEIKFDETKTPLPDHPDEILVERWLLDVRKYFYV